MDFLIHFLLISGLLVLLNGEEIFDLVPSIMKDSIDEYFNNEYNNEEYVLTESPEHRLKLLRGQELGRSANSLVWKGIYNDEHDVAIKIFWDEQSMRKEGIVYEALNSTNDPQIEEFKIPRVYYHGKFLDGYYAIAMSLFDGTLLNFYEKHKNKQISDNDILYIFLQAVKGLEYLSSRNVVHNDIKPENLFYRGKNIFIADFNLASINGAQNEGGTFLYSSANFFARNNRYAMDDLESLIYSLYSLAGLPLEPCKNGLLVFGIFDFMPEGFRLARNLKKGKKYAREKVMKRISFFKNSHVRGVFEDIWDREILSEHNNPDYQEVTKILVTAIDSLNKSRKFLQNDWLSDGICAALTKITRICN